MKMSTIFWGIVVVENPKLFFFLVLLILNSRFTLRYKIMARKCFCHHTQAQKIVVWKLSVSLQNLRWNFIFILLCLLLSKNFGCCCLTFLRGRSWLVKRFTPHGQPTNQRCSLKQAELTVEPLITIFCIL